MLEELEEKESALLALEAMSDVGIASDVVGGEICFCCKNNNIAFGNECPHGGAYPQEECHEYCLDDDDPVETERLIMERLIK